jgi:hypothetical protein
MREKGYYWVKLNDWFFCGLDLPYHDTDIAEVGPRIAEPANVEEPASTTGGAR